MSLICSQEREATGGVLPPRSRPLPSLEVLQGVLLPFSLLSNKGPSFASATCFLDPVQPSWLTFTSNFLNF